VAAGVAVFAALDAESVAALVLALGAAAVATLLAALARGIAPAVPVAVAGLAAAWTVSAWSRGSEAPDATIAVAAAVFLATELAYWSLEQVAVADEPELAARRVAGLALRVAAALALAAFLLAALGLHAHGGLALEAVGVGAAVGLLALVFVLARADSAER
jgi:hypothetical protein